MLTVDLDEFMFELKDGAIKHVGPSNRSATVKLYDVIDAEARPFGNDRIKLSFEAEDDNEAEVAVSPAKARQLREDLDAALEDVAETG